MSRFLFFLFAFLFLKQVVSKEIVASFNSRDLNSHGDRFKRQVLVEEEGYEFIKWPNNTVYYYFDEKEFDPNMKDSVLRAMELISSHTCIKFSTEPSDAVIRMKSENKDYCYADIGNTQRTQRFSFPAACYSSGLAVHELIHSLGFIHAHQRSDRDQYLVFKKKLENLTLDKKRQYAIYQNQDILVPYDYGSVMQYPDYADEYYPIHKNRMMYNTMGSEIVAFYDYLMVNKYYECSCGEKNALKCQNYGYPNPSNCSQCNCPLGYGGAYCSQHPEPGAKLEASEEWQNTTISLDAGYRSNTNGRRSQFDFIYHYLWITAPVNKTTEIRVNNFRKEKCVKACIKGGIEIKTNEDPRLTSPRFCCDETQIKRSQHSPTIIMAFNTEGLDEYVISYRYN